MKKYITIFILIISAFSCSKDEIEVYNSDRYLYFPNVEGQDTAFISFFHYYGKSTLEIPFEIVLVGKVLDQPLTYKLATIDSLTTAKLQEDYDLPETFTFPAHQSKDTLYLKIKKTDKLDSKFITLTLNLVENENFKLGHANRQTVKITFGNEISRPSWWDEEVESSYLGTYSDTKYTVFIATTGVSDLTDIDPARRRQLTRIFKEHVRVNNIKDKDENGNEFDMVIPGY